MRASASILRYCEALSRLGVRLGGILIFLSALLICFETVLRKAAGVSTGGADELSGYALAIGSSLALSFTLLRRGHVRVDAVYTRVPSRARSCLDLLSVSCLSLFSIVLTYFSAQVFLDSLELSAVSNTTLATPLWLPQGIWLIGLALFSATSTLLAGICFVSMVGGDFSTVRALAGSASEIEEFETEPSC